MDLYRALRPASTWKDQASLQIDVEADGGSDELLSADACCCATAKMRKISLRPGSADFAVFKISMCRTNVSTGGEAKEEEEEEEEEEASLLVALVNKKGNPASRYCATRDENALIDPDLHDHQR